MPDAMPPPVLFRWPRQAAFGRVIPKTKFYEHGQVRTAVRDKFVDQIQRITWAYKVADDTVHLRGTSSIPEIQVFTIEIKGQELSNDVLTVMDKTVHFPIIFEIWSRNQIRTTFAHKNLSGKTPRIGAYLTTDWLPAGAERHPLPAAHDLESLYEAILGALLPGRMRAGETVSEATERMSAVGKLRREIAALEKKVRAEPQLNRKVELRRRLREREAIVAELIDSGIRTEEQKWTN
jgi:hypothetical protein